MQKQNDAEDNGEKEEASDIMQKQNDVEDNGEKEEASDIMQKQNDAEDIMQKEEESDANYLRQIEKQQRAINKNIEVQRRKARKRNLRCLHHLEFYVPETRIL